MELELTQLKSMINKMKIEKTCFWKFKSRRIN